MFLQGDEGQRIQWQISRCNNPDSYSSIEEVDQTAIVTSEKRELSKSQCDSPVEEVLSTLKFNTSLDFCRIRCKAYNANNVEITKFYQGIGENFANGTKNVETKGE